jgi:acyl carrier protein phosphodiesterase
MNFLAHCTLASAHPELLVGGFLGDFVKGPVPDLPGELSAGIRLHRHIDAYSHRQADLRRSAERFGPELRRYAPIFVDLIADHFLARDFDTIHQAELSTFTDTAYQCIGDHRRHLSNDAERFYEHARHRDLFAAYQEPLVLERTIERIAQRLRRPELTAQVMSRLAGIERALAADFARYYPALQTQTTIWLQDHWQGQPKPLLPDAPVPTPA